MPETSEPVRRWLPPIVVSVVVGAVVGLGVNLVQTGIENDNVRQNEVDNFLRAERIRAYSDFGKALEAQSTLVNDVLFDVYGDDEYLPGEAVRDQLRIEDGTKGVASAIASVQILGSNRAVIAAEDALKAQKEAFYSMNAALLDAIGPEPSIKIGEDSWVVGYAAALGCRTGRSTAEFTRLVRLDLGAEPAPSSTDTVQCTEISYYAKDIGQVVP
ncbi:hypothetical protein [Rathayibacter sp. AY1F3]|uniref:hypothetical protein n=1 Tax=Rathayibacter sp. AY1F3 TaxID=2080558 RepID=UPI0011AFFD71|nr:hypothetical protein [Rathayibacter sp. AY1F3]